MTQGEVDVAISCPSDDTPQRIYTPDLEELPPQSSPSPVNIHVSRRASTWPVVDFLFKYVTAFISLL
jgi:hypothetical protein